MNTMKMAFTIGIVLIVTVVALVAGEVNINALFKPEDCPRTAQSGDYVTVTFVAFLADDSGNECFEFDNTDNTGPVNFRLNDKKSTAMQGWHQGLEGACVREKREVLIPAGQLTVNHRLPTCLMLMLMLMLIVQMCFVLRFDLIQASNRYEVKRRKSYSDGGTLTNEGHMIEPAQTAAVIPHPSTDADHMPDLPKYKMDRLPRGMCIIFNAENFTKEDLKKRDGTQKDVEALLNTFQNRLKFKTCVVQDPTRKEYVECLQNIGRMDHSTFDCFVCVILSHGFGGLVYGTDGGTVSIDALTGLFRGDYVPSLVDKPKLFFIQACQGEYPQDSVDIQQDGPTTLPFKSDILISHSTIPGYASFRSAKRGSLFIISLCNIINTYYKEKVDLLSMLTMVNERMSHKAIEGKWMEMGKQIGIHSNVLRKQIFFNEGLDE